MYLKCDFEPFCNMPETNGLCLVRHLIGMSQLQSNLFFRKLYL